MQTTPLGTADAEGPVEARKGPECSCRSTHGPRATEPQKQNGTLFFTNRPQVRRYPSMILPSPWNLAFLICLLPSSRLLDYDPPQEMALVNRTALVVGQFNKAGAPSALPNRRSHGRN